MSGYAGSGNRGGGINVIFARYLSGSGSISSNGLNGESGTEEGSAGGGGAGGANNVKTAGISGNFSITATGGAKGIRGSGGNGGDGGDGSVGRNRIETCSGSVSSNPTASTVIGGQKWCGGLAAVL